MLSCWSVCTWTAPQVPDDTLERPTGGCH